MSAKIKNIRKVKNHYQPRGINHHTFRKVYWPYIPLLLFIGLAFSLNVRSGNIGALTFGNTNSKVLSYASSMSRNGMLDATNAERLLSGVNMLRENEKLDLAAQAKANDMVARNYWSHETPDGQQPWVFIDNQHYYYQKIGENLATGFSNEVSVINGWMASPHHKDNLLDTSFSEVGFGIAQNPNYTAAGGGPMTLVVAFYGKPSVNISTSLAIISNPSTQNRTSRAQLALADSSISIYATYLVIGAMGAAITIWVNRHLKKIRRAVTAGEKFVIDNPLFDAGMIILLTLLFLLLKTAGLVL